MTTKEILTNPEYHWTFAHEPSYSELKAAFGIPNIKVVVTPTLMISREDWLKEPMKTLPDSDQSDVDNR